MHNLRMHFAHSILFKSAAPNMMSYWTGQEKFIYFVGCCSLLYFLYCIFIAFHRIVYVHVLAKKFGKVTDLTKYGKWAVVTGATDGIGKGYAKELAKRGLNVFLISRNQEKLDSTAKEILTDNPDVQIKTLAFDFDCSTLSSYDLIKKALVDYDIGILVNNVGVCNECPDYFLTYPGGDDFWKKLINVNCFAVAEMTYIVLPQMLRRQKGIVINLSSSSAFSPVPLLSLYSGTKVLIGYFTRGLMNEYANSGVIFQCVYPGFVATNMSKVKPSFIAPDPYSYAREALDTVGIENETVGCFSHALQITIAQMLPQTLCLYFVKQRLLDARERYMRQKAKSQ